MFCQLSRHILVVLIACAAMTAAQAQTTWYVDDDAPNDPGPNNPDISDPLEDGSTEHPFDTIQEAIDAADEGDEVIVHVGTYDIIDFVGKVITVRGTNPNDPDIVATTIIAGEEEFSPDTVVTASDGTLSGFTVRNGTIAISYGSYEHDYAYSPTITHCVTGGCYYGVKGYNPYQHDPITPIIRNNIIVGRLGGIWLDEQAFAGGVHAVIQNNVIIGAEATYGRGIVYRMHEALPTVTGNIITDWNVGIDLVYSSLAEERKALITHNDVWGNTDNYKQSEQPFDLTGLQGNISADPLWVDQVGGDYHLLEGSPCANAGNPDFEPAPDETDIDGEDRVQQCRVDMGPDESPYFPDCNDNGVSDACDIASGTSDDINGNGIPDECECWGDLNGDGVIDLADLAQLLGNYGTTSGAVYEDGDMDCDGDVDLSDLAALLGVYGTTCP